MLRKGRFSDRLGARYEGQQDRLESWNREVRLPSLHATFLRGIVRDNPSMRVFRQTRSSRHVGAWRKQNSSRYTATHHPNQESTEHQKSQSCMHHTQSSSTSRRFCRSRGGSAGSVLPTDSSHLKYLQEQKSELGRWHRLQPTAKRKPRRLDTRNTWSFWTSRRTRCFHQH